ncbi:MAG: DUF4157 domain-containing protein, partial [Leptospirales bacterium]|nr:DUF4157 domain-containing protein [Leptospirales bacterium]
HPFVKNTTRNQNPAKAYPSQETVVSPTNRMFVQRTLEVGQSGDFYERQADAMADIVMRESFDGGEISTPPAGNGISTIQRSGGTSAFVVSPGMEGQLSSSHGGGNALPPALRSQMEGSFGFDFSTVRLHTGTPAAQMSSEINARAFTHGNDIYFNEGQYQPENTSGQHLLAHELTHVVQQTGKVQRFDDNSAAVIGEAYIAQKNKAAEEEKQKKIQRWKDIDDLTFDIIVSVSPADCLSNNGEDVELFFKYFNSLNYTINNVLNYSLPIDIKSVKGLVFKAYFFKVNPNFEVEEDIDNLSAFISNWENPIKDRNNSEYADKCKVVFNAPAPRELFTGSTLSFLDANRNSIGTRRPITVIFYTSTKTDYNCAFNQDPGARRAVSNDSNKSVFIFQGLGSIREYEDSIKALVYTYGPLADVIILGHGEFDLIELGKDLLLNVGESQTESLFMTIGELIKEADDEFKNSGRPPLVHYIRLAGCLTNTTYSDSPTKSQANLTQYVQAILGNQAIVEGNLASAGDSQRFPKSNAMEDINDPSITKSNSKDYRGTEPSGYYRMINDNFFISGDKQVAIQLLIDEETKLFDFVEHIITNNMYNIEDGPTTWYWVLSGDNMWTIAKRHGIELDALIIANPWITNPSLIFPGDLIEIPNRTTDNIAFAQFNELPIFEHIIHIAAIKYIIANQNNDNTLIPFIHSMGKFNNFINTAIEYYRIQNNLFLKDIQTLNGNSVKDVMNKYINEIKFDNISEFTLTPPFP